MSGCLMPLACWSEQISVFTRQNELTENANNRNSSPQVVTCFVLFAQFEKPLTFCYFLPCHLGQVSSSIDFSLKGSPRKDRRISINHLVEDDRRKSDPRVCEMDLLCC